MLPDPMERSPDDIRDLLRHMIVDGHKDTATKVLRDFGAAKVSEIDPAEHTVAYETLLSEWETIQQVRQPLVQFERFKYGKRWKPVCIERQGRGGKVERIPVRALMDIEIEMQSYLSYDTQVNTREQKEYRIYVPGALGKYEHAKRGMEMIWGTNSRKPFVSSPYTERMLKALCEHKFLAIAGHASGSKTYTPSAWGVWNYLCYPNNTKVLFSSTSLKDSRSRIWGDVEEFWSAASDFYNGDMPGKLVSSGGTIRSIIEGRATDKAGLTLIAGDQSESEKSIAKVKGFKRARFFFICDEMTDLSENLLISAESNLRSNPFFQMVGIGNPNSYYDPLGKMCEPVDGWSSANETMMEWQGKRAYVIRFDARSSPNVVAKKNIYKGLLTYETYEEARNKMGENNPQFYQMYRGYWCPTGSVESIYTESEIVTYRADQPVGSGWTFAQGFDKVWSLDPAFKQGGDDAIFTVGHVGICSDTGYVTFERKQTIRIDIDVNDPLPKDEQVVMRVKQLLPEHGLEVANGAVDVTGAASFGSLLRREIGEGWMAVEFGGKPSEMPASNTDPRPSHEIYDRMVAELWHVGKELIRNRQIRGLDPDTIKQMVSRTYEVRNKKIRVQPKDELKKITGTSPDRADSLFLCIHAARKRFKLTSKEQSAGAEKKPPTGRAFATWAQNIRKAETFHGQVFTYGA